MTSKFDQDLQSGDDDRILPALYALSGEGRFADLEPSSYDLAPTLVTSTNEEIAWRAIFFFGLVRPTALIADSLIDAIKRWQIKAPYVASAAFDSIARLIEKSALDPARQTELLAELSRVPKIDGIRLSALEKLHDGRISYEDYVALGAG